MIMALLEKDDLSLEEIKSMTKGKLMKKIGLLIKALDGKVTDHHRFLLKLHFEHIDSISSQIALLDEEIYQKLEIHNKEFELIRTVPGINAITGASIIAEIGVDMSRFPSEHHLASWAAMCPGNNESAGKRKSGRTRRGNNYLKTTLVEAAWAASRTKGTFLGAKYHITAKRRGGKRAAVAIGHQILKAVYHIISRGESYKEIGAESARNRKSEARNRSIIRELEKLGYSVRKVESSTG